MHDVPLIAESDASTDRGTRFVSRYGGSRIATPAAGTAELLVCRAPCRLWPAASVSVRRHLLKRGNLSKEGFYRLGRASENPSAGC